MQHFFDAFLFFTIEVEQRNTLEFIQYNVILLTLSTMKSTETSEMPNF